MLSPATGAPNIFVKLDKSSVIGALKATGSRDPDVLHAQKEALLSSVRGFKVWGILLLVGGGFCTLTIVGAVVGIPAILFGWFALHRRSGNIAAVEAGYSEYIATGRA